MKTAELDKLRESSIFISKLDRQRFDLTIDREIIQDRVNLFESELELEIAEDPSFRNAEMRKAQKTISLATSQDYQQLKIDLRKIEQDIFQTTSELELHRREFSILKLEKQAEIYRAKESV